jgi:hypothetical protein
LAVGLLQTFGGACAANLLFGLVALRAKRGTVIGVALAGLSVFGLLAAGYGEGMTIALDGGADQPPLMIQPFFLLFGLGLSAIVGRIAWRASSGGRRRPDYLFLAAWVIIEAVGCWAISPFCAIRRILGLSIASTLLIAKLASSTCPRGERRRIVWACAAMGAALGVLFWAVDYREACIIRDSAVNAAEFIRSKDPQARVWYTGHWGFQYYADRAGMQPLMGGRSRVQPGDWIVSPREVHRQHAFGSEEALELIASFGAQPGLFGLRTVPHLYSGDVPIHSTQGDAAVVILRCRREFTPSLLPKGANVLEL